MYCVNNRISLFSVAILTVFSLFGCKGKPEVVKAKQAPETIVDVLVAGSQSISNNLQVNGNVVENEYVELYPEARGLLIYLNVPGGLHIAAGTVIARVNDADLK